MRFSIRCESISIQHSALIVYPLPSVFRTLWHLDHLKVRARRSPERSTASNWIQFNFFGNFRQTKLSRILNASIVAFGPKWERHWHSLRLESTKLQIIVVELHFEWFIRAVSLCGVKMLHSSCLFMSLIGVVTASWIHCIIEQILALITAAISVSVS